MRLKELIITLKCQFPLEFSMLNIEMTFITLSKLPYAAKCLRSWSHGFVVSGCVSLGNRFHLGVCSWQLKS